MIKTVNLNKYFLKGKQNEIHVLNDVSIMIPTKGLTVILGPSGSGKTTLLNVLGGLDNAHGELVFDDERITKKRMKDYRMKNIGYVFQNYNLFLEHTVYDNLDIALSIYGVKRKEERDLRINYALEAVGLKKHSQRLASTLSGGEQQRVSIARALIKDTKVLIADEPTGNLDSRNTLEIISILKHIAKERAVILVTHEHEIAYAFGDYILKMEDGRIVSDSYNDGQNMKIDISDSKKVIYRKDLVAEDFGTDELSIKTYKDNSIHQELSLEIYMIGESTYIKTNGNAKIIGVNTEVLIIDSHKKELSAKDYDKEFQFPTISLPRPTFFGGVIRFSKVFKKAFIRFLYGSGKGSIFSYAYFFVIGIALCSMLLLVDAINDPKIDNGQYLSSADPSVVTILANDKQSISMSEIKELFDHDIVDEMRVRKQAPRHIAYTTVSSFGSTVQLGGAFASINSFDGKVVFGRLPNNEQEILIDQRLFQAGINSTRQSLGITLKPDAIIGKQVSFYGKTFLITGITNSDTCYYYFDDLVYHQLRQKEYHYWYEMEPLYDYKFRTHEDVDYIRQRDPSRINIFVSHEFLEANPTFNSYYYNVIGKINADSEVDFYFETEGDYDDYKQVLANVITNPSSAVDFTISQMNSIACLLPVTPMEYFKEELLYGRPAKYDNEIVINYDVYTKISSSLVFKEQEFLNGMKIVGVFKTETGNEADIYATIRALKKGYFAMAYAQTVDVYSLDNDTFFISLKDYKTGISELRARGYEVKSYIDFKASIDSEKLFDTFRIVISILSVLLFLALFLIFFPMRSKILKNIRSIGIYRALGTKKRSLYAVFIADSFILASLTAVLGYIFTFFYLMGINNQITLLDPSIELFLLGLGTIYLAFITFSVLPLWGVLRNTPANIISKYDI